MNIGKEALGCITEKDPKLTFWREIFSLDSSKSLKAILLYAERAWGCITEKDPKLTF